MKKTILILVLLLGVFGINSKVFAHCEVPCGIYDDKARISMIHEHVETIEKAMNEITELSAQGEKNYNQIIRWVTTKDEHATQIQQIVSQYFLTQRIKPVPTSDAAGYAKYIHELTLLHGMMISAMKSKQTLDTSYPQALHQSLESFSESYFAAEKKSKENMKDVKSTK